MLRKWRHRDFTIKPRIRARYTTPIPPRPSSRVMLQVPRLAPLSRTALRVSKSCPNEGIMSDERKPTSRRCRAPPATHDTDGR